jgi:hypothetical protein
MTLIAVTMWGGWMDVLEQLRRLLHVFHVGRCACVCSRTLREAAQGAIHWFLKSAQTLSSTLRIVVTARRRHQISAAMLPAASAIAVQQNVRFDVVVDIERVIAPLN